jgi:aminoglycoside 6'-N-acetyltransferase
VARWWPDPHAPAELEARYGPAIDGHDAAEVFVVEADGEPIGMVQRVWLAREPQWAAALGVASDVDLDYLIGVPAFLRRGIGAAMLDAFVEETFRSHPEVQGVSSAPQQANVASWRALERAGFVRARTVAQLASDDPSDAGPAYVYLRRRPLELPLDDGVAAESETRTVNP